MLFSIVLPHLNICKAFELRKVAINCMLFVSGRPTLDDTVAKLFGILVWQKFHALTNQKFLPSLLSCLFGYIHIRYGIYIFTWKFACELTTDAVKFLLAVIFESCLNNGPLELWLPFQMVYAVYAYWSWRGTEDS